MHRYQTRARLRLHDLEARDMPAGSVAASLSAGVVTLTGDAAANGLTVTKAGNSFTVTPDATTAVNGGAVGQAVVLTGSVTQLRVALGDGNDSFAIDALADFAIAGATTIDLGRGDNAAFLATDGTLDLGSLAVIAADGNDELVVAGDGFASRVAGAATFDFGPGESATTLTGVSFEGAGGVRVTATGGGNASDVTARDVAVSRTLAIDFGSSFGSFDLSASTLGGVTAKALDLTGVFTNVAVGGDATLSARNGPTLTVSDSSVAGVLSATGTDAAGNVSVGFDGFNLLGGVRLQGANVTAAIGSDPGDLTEVAGEIRLTGTLSAILDASDGDFLARDVVVSSSRGEAAFEVGGVGTTVTGSISIVGVSRADLLVTGGTLDAGRIAVISKKEASVVLSDLATGLTLDGDLAVTGATGASVMVTAGDLMLRDAVIATARGTATFDAVTGAYVGRDLTVQSKSGDAVVAAGGDSLSLDGTLAVRGGTTAAVDVIAGTLDAQEIRVSAAGQAEFVHRAAALGVTVDGAIAVDGGSAASLDVRGDSLSARFLAVRSKRGEAEVNLRAPSVDVQGDVEVTGGSAVQLSIVPTFAGAASVGGAVRVSGGSSSDEVTFRGTVDVAGDVVLNFGGGDDTATLEGTAVGGGLSFVGGGGADTASLVGVEVSGRLDVRGDAGADLLSIEGGSMFLGIAAIDLGTDSDIISFAQTAAAAGPVRFLANASIKLGGGKDQLLLGKSVMAGGDASTAVQFDGATDLIDGGAGTDVFGAADSQYTGAMPMNL